MATRKTDPHRTAAEAVQSMLRRSFCSLSAQLDREAANARLRQDEPEAARMERDAAELRDAMRKVGK